MQVFILSIKEAALISDEYCLKNFPLRMERAERFRFREDKLRCVAAGALLSGILGIKESELKYNTYGKPYCGGIHDYARKVFSAEAWTDFSISHSGKYAVLAASDENVGVDIEDMARRHIDIAKRVFLPEEIEWMDSSDTDRRFYVLWTLKESIMKAEGRGLSMEPSGFSVLPAASERDSVADLSEYAYSSMTDALGEKSIGIGRNEYFGSSIGYDGHMISICSGRREAVRYSLVTSEML